MRTTKSTSTATLWALVALIVATSTLFSAPAGAQSSSTSDCNAAVASDMPDVPLDSPELARTIAGMQQLDVHAGYTETEDGEFIAQSVTLSADVRVRLFRNTPNGLEAAIENLIATCGWTVGNDIEADMIILGVSIDERETWNRWGEQWDSALSGRTNENAVSAMGEQFANQQFDDGFVAGIRVMQSKITDVPRAPFKVPLKPIGVVVGGLLALTVGGSTMSSIRRRQEERRQLEETWSSNEDEYSRVYQRMVEAHLDVKPDLSLLDVYSEEDSDPVKQLWSEAETEYTATYNDHALTEQWYIEARTGESQRGLLDEHSAMIQLIVDSYQKMQDVQEMIAALRDKASEASAKAENISQMIKEAEHEFENLRAAGLNIEPMIEQNMLLRNEANLLRGGLITDVTKSDLGSTFPVDDALERAATLHDEVVLHSHDVQGYQEWVSSLKEGHRVLQVVTSEARQLATEAHEDFDHMEASYDASNWIDVAGHGSTAEGILDEVDEISAAIQADLAMSSQSFAKAEQSLIDADQKLLKANDLLRAVKTRRQTLDTGEEQSREHLAEVRTELDEAAAYFQNNKAEVTDTSSKQLEDAEAEVEEIERLIELEHSNWLLVIRELQMLDEHLDDVLKTMEDRVLHFKNLRRQRRSLRDEFDVAVNGARSASMRSGVTSSTQTLVSSLESEVQDFRGDDETSLIADIGYWKDLVDQANDAEQKAAREASDYQDELDAKRQRDQRAAARRRASSSSYTYGGGGGGGGSSYSSGGGGGGGGFSGGGGGGGGSW